MGFGSVDGVSNQAPCLPGNGYRVMGTLSGAAFAISGGA